MAALRPRLVGRTGGGFPAVVPAIPRIHLYPSRPAFFRAYGDVVSVACPYPPYVLLPQAPAANIACKYEDVGDRMGKVVAHGSLAGRAATRGKRMDDFPCVQPILVSACRCGTIDLAHS